MIDLENKEIKEFIEEHKKKLESEIIKCFKCNLIPLYGGKAMGGLYHIIIDYESQEGCYGISKGFHIATNVIISKNDYDKGIIKEDKNEKSTYTPGHQWCR